MLVITKNNLKTHWQTKKNKTIRLTLTALDVEKLSSIEADASARRIRSHPTQETPVSTLPSVHTILCLGIQVSSEAEIKWGWAGIEVGLPVQNYHIVTSHQKYAPIKDNYLDKDFMFLWHTTAQRGFDNRARVVCNRKHNPVPAKCARISECIHVHLLQLLITMTIFTPVVSCHSPVFYYKHYVRAAAVMIIVA